MTDLELVIRIPPKVYKAICDKNALGCDIDDIKNIIRNGMSLPKGHGRLIDADDAKREWRNVLDCEVEHPRYQCTIRDVLEDAPTIIEADKGEVDGK